MNCSEEERLRVRVWIWVYSATRRCGGSHDFIIFTIFHIKGEKSREFIFPDSSVVSFLEIGTKLA